MADKEHLKILKSGVGAWNRWRSEAPDVVPCLNGADLRSVDFSVPDPVAVEHPEAGKFLRNLYRHRNYAASQIGVDFHAAELNGARLNHANMFRANLFGAKLEDAKLTGAILREAVLTNANLSRATLSEVDLRNAILGGTTILRKAKLQFANLSSALLSGADLTSASLTWADLRKAVAPDSIFVDTDLRYANLTRAVFAGAKFNGADLSQSQLVFTDLRGADIAGTTVFGVSAWGVQLNSDTKQSDLIVTPRDESAVTADGLEVAQFVYLLLNNTKIQNAIDTIGKKGVLILGRFTAERKVVLDAIRNSLRAKGFVPIMFDFEKPTQRDFTETIKTLAGLSRFIIADITNPKSSPLELQAIVPDYMIPFVPIIQENEEPFAMFRDLKQKHGQWVLDVLKYDSAENLVNVLDKAVIRPALERGEALLLKKAEEMCTRHVHDYL